VHYYELTIACTANIEFETVAPGLQCQIEGGKCIFGKVGQACAPVAQ